MGTSSGKELKTVAPFPGADELQPTRPSSAQNAKSSQSSPYDPLGRTDPGLNHSSSNVGFNFSMTEGQTRRNLLADCDFECSPVCDFLFVSGAKVASSIEKLNKYGITRIINCAVTVVDNYFIDNPKFMYLSLNLLDSRQDDLIWFVAQTIHFIEKGRLLGQKTLIHCEKGVSRSCSFAIAYFMWARGLGWKESFELVKRGRPVCAPNTGFWCNLIEFSDLLHGSTKATTLLFRCASHLQHDPNTAVLKLCINPDTRKILMPRTSLLDPRGIFVLRCGANSQNSRLFVWAGSNSSSNALTESIKLAHFMMGVFSLATGVTIVQQSNETDEFRREIMEDGPFNPRSLLADNVIYDDLYLAEPIVISRQNTPLTKLRGVAPDPSPDNTPRTARTSTPDNSSVPGTRLSAASGINLASVERSFYRESPQQQHPQTSQPKEVDIFVRVRRNSKNQNDHALIAAQEADRIIATFNALTAAKSTAPKSTASNGTSPPLHHGAKQNRECQQFNTSPIPGKLSGKRNAEEMEIDTPECFLAAKLEDQPSPKYHISNPPSSELSGENFESFRLHPDMYSLNKDINDCRIGGNSIDSQESNHPVNDNRKSLGYSPSVIVGRDQQKAKSGVEVNLQLPIIKKQDPIPSLLSIVDKAAEYRHPEKSSLPGGGIGGGVSAAGKYEIWSTSPTGSTSNSAMSLPVYVNDSVDKSKELHPDHVDSPHLVTYREKPLLYLATPTDEDMPNSDDFMWLPMGVYDDEDLQEDALLLLVCPKGPHYLWVGSNFRIPDESFLVKKNTPSGGFDDVSDEGLGQTDGLLMSKEDKRVFLWAQSIDNTAIVFRKKNEIFSPGNLSIQRQREEDDSYFTAFYDGM